MSKKPADSGGARRKSSRLSQGFSEEADGGGEGDERKGRKRLFSEEEKRGAEERRSSEKKPQRRSKKTAKNVGQGKIQIGDTNPGWLSESILIFKNKNVSFLHSHRRGRTRRSREGKKKYGRRRVRE